MKQVLVKGGTVSIESVPPPTVAPGHILVRVRRSLISSGTESGYVSSGGTASFVMKKAQDPLNIEKVKRKIASVGVKGTLDVIKNKLFEYQVPGYSTAGEILAVGDGVQGFREGDLVACSGVGYACHAEYNLVPHQLVTPIPDNVSMEEAAFVTLGAIALQGLRQAQPTLGETMVVSGLGLIGQLAVQLAKAAGCHVIGCDPVESKRELALSLGAEATCTPDALSETVGEWTGGHGADAVIVCAAAKGSEVTNQAIDVCRQKGRVSVIGAVGLQLQRESLYLKEIDFRLSCSYGPGRYQANYEEKGLDYPIGYVRWTEGRNMAEFLRLVARGAVQVKPLISTTQPVDQAQAAYDTVLAGDGTAIAALIDYGDEEACIEYIEREWNIVITNPAPKSKVGVSVIGAGGFASQYHLPSLKKIPGTSIACIVNRTGGKAKQAAQKFGALNCSTDFQDALTCEETDAVVIATRHNLHAEITLAALEAGKHVFVEKPMAMTVADCDRICALAAEKELLVSVGFNRRFSPFAQTGKTALQSVQGPKNILYRCNAGALPADHWSLDPEEGGGRILGEGVHFFDLCCWLMDADPVAITAERINSQTVNTVAEDNCTTVLRFADGSTATIVYTALGHPSMGKERIEAFGGGGGWILDDFRSIELHGLPGASASGRTEQKGQFGVLENFIHAIQGKAGLDITAAHGRRATAIACEVLAQLRGNTGANA